MLTLLCTCHFRSWQRLGISLLLINLQLAINVLLSARMHRAESSQRRFQAAQRLSVSSAAARKTDSRKPEGQFSGWVTELTSALCPVFGRLDSAADQSRSSSSTAPFSRRREPSGCQLEKETITHGQGLFVSSGPRLPN